MLIIAEIRRPFPNIIQKASFCRPLRPSNQVSVESKVIILDLFISSIPSIL